MRWNVSVVSAVFSLRRSSDLLSLFTFCSVTVLLFRESINKLKTRKPSLSSADGVTAALPAGLVHGRSLEFAAGTHRRAAAGGPHIPQGPAAGLHLQGG